VNLFRDAFVKFRKVALHLWVRVPNDPLKRTVKDYVFKINILAGDLERGVLAPSKTTSVTIAASMAPAPTVMVGLLRWRLPLLN
jgi:hypothetical protein